MAFLFYAIQNSRYNDVRGRDNLCIPRNKIGKQGILVRVLENVSMTKSNSFAKRPSPAVLNYIKCLKFVALYICMYMIRAC